MENIIDEKKQDNWYQVIASDGITVVDTIIASNKKDAYRFAKEKHNMYNYMLKRVYNGGVRG